MVYSSAVFAFCLLTTFVENNTEKWMYAGLLTTYSILVSLIYLVVVEPVFHHVSYGVLVAILLLLPSLHIRRLSKRKISKIHTRQLIWIYLSGTISFLLGHAYTQQLLTQ